MRRQDWSRGLVDAEFSAGLCATLKEHLRNAATRSERRQIVKDVSEMVKLNHMTRRDANEVVKLAMQFDAQTSQGAIQTKPRALTRGRLLTLFDYVS